MRVAVPFDAEAPKTRLSPVLEEAERAAFARVLLRDVLATLRATGREPTVYATAALGDDVDAAVEVDDSALDPLVNGLLAEGPLAVVMADLGVVTPGAVERLFEAEGDVVLAPGRGGGTNALLVRDDAFRVDFHGVSLRDHREIAGEAGLDVTEVDSMRLSTDVDEPADLVEVLLHGEGRAPEWLRERGIRVAVEDGRASVARE